MKSATTVVMCAAVEVTARSGRGVRNEEDIVQSGKGVRHPMTREVLGYDRHEACSELLREVPLVLADPGADRRRAQHEHDRVGLGDQLLDALPPLFTFRNFTP